MAFSRSSKVRTRLIEILKPYKGWGVEVGVQEGLFSRELLQNLSIQKLVMVDAWRKFDKYDDIANCSDELHAIKLLSAFQNTQEFKDRRTILVEESVKAAEMFMESAVELFDWAYIDAAHDKVSVLRDLEAWECCVKAGGTLCGDDFYDGKTEFADFGVKSAVEKFVSDRQLELNLIEEPGELAQWWVRL